MKRRITGALQDWGMEMIVSKVPIFVLGSRGKLRNPRIESLSDQITYVEPVFLSSGSDESWSKILREIALNGRKLTLGERGCALGHIKVRDAVLSSGVPWALVLEDDADLPDDWAHTLQTKLQDLEEESFSILLFNTNPLLALSDDPVEIRIKPSGGNAFLISREGLLRRRYNSLEENEIADWPLSFVRETFFLMSGFANDKGDHTLVGKRPSNRVKFFVASIIRLAFAPLLCVFLRVRFLDYLRWSILGPVVRDVILRFHRSAALK